MPRFSLRSLTLAFLLLFLLATGLTGLATHSASNRVIRQLVDERVRQVSLAVAPEGGVRDARDLARRVDALNRERETGDLGFALFGPDGRQIAGNTRLARALPDGLSDVDMRDNIKRLAKGRALARDLPGGLRLVVIAETQPFAYGPARDRIYLVGFGSIIAIVLIGLLLFSRLVSQRITQMRRTVDRIIEGGMDERVPLNGDRSAFDGQAEGFNRMLDRIQTLMAEIQNVSTDIAHELRTPLTRLRGRLERLHGLARSETEQEGLAGALEDADELLAMFTAILRIAEIEGGERRGGFGPVDLGDLTREIVAILEPVAEEGERRLAMGSCHPIRLRGDRQLLSQLLINLIENALRHTPPGALVTVSVLRQGMQAEIRVSDDGPGIAVAQRATALRRFGRVGPPGVPGHGMGLPLIDAIARLHGGEMHLEDARPGLCVRVFIPMG